ncbi:MAG: cell division protein ZapA [Clostridia bacterium]|nr:cell division protein ZapA [Clostridia bacterium]
MSKVRIRIAGKDYGIVGTEPEEYIQKIGLYVDKKMSEIMESGENNLSTMMVSVLSAVNIADDYFKERDKANQQKTRMAEMEKKIRDLQIQVNSLEQKNQKLEEQKSELKIKLVEAETELRQVKNHYK